MIAPLCISENQRRYDAILERVRTTRTLGIFGKNFQSNTRRKIEHIQNKSVKKLVSDIIHCIIIIKV
jgi:hypothetical protein